MQTILDPSYVADKNRLALDDATLEPQAGQFCYESYGESEQKEQITQFFESDPNYTCVVESEINDETRMQTSQNVESLEEFFARPVKIATSTWAVGQGLNVAGLNIWSLWMRNKRVSNRLNNFKNFRGKLHVKFILNGNSFYWGRAFASYTPFTNNSFVSQDTNWLDYPRATMKPHIWLDPSTSQAGEMVLPFFWPSDHFNLNTDNPDRLGNMWIYSPVGLQHAQSNTQSVSVQVYAWVTDISLSTPTQVPMAGLVPQAGDEYGSGPISRPANVVAALAGKMAKAPMIGPYAMATQMAASTVGSIAKMFGYSRPRNIIAPKVMKVWQTGDLASTDQEDTATTLAFTSKQEVTIDPRTVGLGSQDEMDFDYLMKKPVLFANFTWSFTSIFNQALFSVRVNPMVYRRDSYLGSSPGYALTTTALCALPFKYWRGSMTYRFSVVASGYHKGRLLFVWEPTTPPSDPQATPPESNVTYSKVVDIAKERDFSITIGWGSNYTALDVPNPMRTGESGMFTAGLPIQAVSGVDNGVLTCYVLNPLVSSGDNTSPITIMVHSSSDDMEVWSPSSDNLKNLTMRIQPNPPPPPRQAEENDDTGLQPQTGALGDVDQGVQNAAEETSDLGTVGGSELPQTMRVFTAGECVKSWRTILKRYTLRRSIMINSTIPIDKFASIYFSGNAYPYMPDVPYPNVSGGVFRGPFTPHALIFYCYAGWRGSYRTKLLPAVIGNGQQWSSTSMTVARGNAIEVSDPILQLYDRDPNGVHDFDADHDSSWSGCQISNPVQGNVLDFELPWYSGYRFSSPVVATVAREMGYEATTLLDNPGANDRDVFAIVKEFSAIGEDYNLFFFLGVPPLWYKP